MPIRFFLLLLSAILFPASLYSQVIQDIGFLADYDQTSQRYMLLLPERFDASESHDLLIALHGHGSDRRQFIENPRPECAGVREFAAKYNMILVSPDYRAPTSWMGPAAEADLLQILDFLKEHYKISRVFLCGGSMGGTAALIFAVRYPERIDGVAAMNATANLLEFDNFQDAIAASYGGTKEEIPLEYKNRSAEYWPEKFSFPVGLTVSGNDTVVPPQSVLRLAAILKRLKKDVFLINRENGGHETNLEDTKAILEYMLKPV